MVLTLCFKVAFLQLAYGFFSLILILNLQIQAAVVALRNTRGLPWPKEYNKRKDEDILDWLQAMFGFQVMLFCKILTWV